MPEPYYASADDLRARLNVSEEMLPDEESVKLLSAAETLVDERLGNWPVNEETGRKIDVEDESIKPWRLEKLAGATVEVAAVIFEDPGVVSRQRARFSSGDVSVSGFYGPAFGELGAALLNQSGLVRNTARMSGGSRRRR
jgi:hypothetical protein